MSKRERTSEFWHGVWLQSRCMSITTTAVVVGEREASWGYLYGKAGIWVGNREPVMAMMLLMRAWRECEYSGRVVQRHDCTYVRR